MKARRGEHADLLKAQGRVDPEVPQGTVRHGPACPKDVFDRDYRSGAWDHLEGTEELPRYLVLAGLVTTLVDRPAVLDWAAAADGLSH